MQAPVLLTSDGYRDNKSTTVLLGQDGTRHICYIKDEGSGEGLYYRTITPGGALGPEIKVDDGGWWSRMQLDSAGWPMFVREYYNYEIWPTEKYRLALFTTTDGLSWEQRLLNAPGDSDKPYRLGDFLYQDGRYHVTFGDSAYTKEVWDGFQETARGPGTFHNLHYVTSTDGVHWTQYLVNGSGTLYEQEFWTTMILSQGSPLVAMFQYNEYDNHYCMGTSAILHRWTGAGFDAGTIITNQLYPNTNEGMGVGLVEYHVNDFFGAWDFSPVTPQILPPSDAGNTALSRSGVSGTWPERVQLAPYSMEGAAKLRLRGDRLYFLALENYLDARLAFREFRIADVEQVLPYIPSSDGGAPPAGKNGAIPAIYLLLR